MSQITIDQTQILIIVFGSIMVLITLLIVIRKIRRSRSKTKAAPKKWEPKTPNIYHIRFAKKGTQAYVRGDASEYDLKHTLAEAHCEKIEKIIMSWNFENLEKGWFRVLPQRNQLELLPAEKGSKGAFFATVISKR